MMTYEVLLIRTGLITLGVIGLYLWISFG